MFYHSKELQFKARVSKPDPRFARLLLEQFGGGNGELKAAMQYFVQAFACHNPYPDKYDMLMDIATEELGHLEIVGATIQMLLAGVNGNLKDAAERNDVFGEGIRRHGEDRQCFGIPLGEAADRSGGFITIHDRHLDIHKNKVIQAFRRSFYFFNCNFSIFCRFHFRPCHLQNFNSNFSV